MGILDVLRPDKRRRSAAWLDRLIYTLSIFVVPALIVLFSLLSLVILDRPEGDRQGTAIPFQLAANPGNDTAPAQGLRILHTTGAQAYEFFLNADSSYWMRVAPPGREYDDGMAVELPSRHLRALRCWDASSHALLGEADRKRAQGGIRQAKSGFVVETDGTLPGDSILCLVSTNQSTQLNMQAWTPSALKASISQFHRITGLLEGGLLTMAVFILIIAFTNREWLYVLFAAWIVGNLRLGAQSMGWDNLWLGKSIPQEWLPLVRQLTIAIYFLLTYSLFTRLFRSRLPQAIHSYAMLLVQVAGLALLASALVLPPDAFEVVLWVVAGLGIFTTILLLAHVLYLSRARIEPWHIMSLSMALCVMLSGVLLFAFGGSHFLDTFNSVIALLLSNLVVALAVAERMRNERDERQQAQAELVSNYAVTPLGMFTLNRDQVIERANPLFYDILRITPDDSARLRWTDLLPAIDWDELASRTRAGEGKEITWPDADSGGIMRHLLVKASIADDMIEGSIQDISAYAETVRHLSQLADNDPLTEVLNRRGIEKALEDSLQALTNGQPCALAYLDLDHFKRINGLFGHTTGDEVLKQVCQRVKHVLSERERIGRLSNNEFIILFPNTNIDDASKAAQHVLEALHEAPIQVGPRAIQVKGSMGVVEVTDQMLAKDAISAASRACRDAQKSHQDMVTYSHNAIELLEHSEELRLFSELEGGASPKGLYLEMQPIVSLRTPLQAMDFEILLRVRDSAGKLIPTGKIISSAEESGTISIIDKWVFSATLEWLDKYRGDLPQTSFVCVNMSGVSLNDQRFIEAFFEILGRYEHLTHLLCVEITEGVALNDLDKTRQFMRRLQRKGVRIALDDFGAGYSSFSYLTQLPADAIKIDGALIRDMAGNPANIAVVRTITELARNLNMKSIVEWVEDVETLQLLWDMEVDYVQGFGVARPQPPGNLLKATSMADLIANAETLELVHRRTGIQDRQG